MIVHFILSHLQSMPICVRIKDLRIEVPRLIVIFLFTAFLWLFLIVLFICGLSKISQRIFQRYFIASTTTSTSHLDSDNEVQSNQQVQPVKSTPNRLHSLDTFRGLAIVTMIFANNGCGEYHWLEHASWNGIHPADFIFPSFLWIMGVCIPISMKSQFAKNIPTKDLLSNIFIVSSVFVRKI